MDGRVMGMNLRIYKLVYESLIWILTNSKQNFTNYFQAKKANKGFLEFLEEMIEKHKKEAGF